MRILIMGQHYAPEEISGAVLATELASDLVRRGHQVTFVTCAPNYPEGKVFAGYRNQLHREEVMQGVRVIRIWSYISTKRDIWRRILNFGTFSASAMLGGLIGGKHDVILSVSPPLPLGISAWILRYMWRVPWVLRVEDLFPKAAISAGLIRGRISQKILYSLERFLYQKAEHISLISEAFRTYVLSKGIAPEKLSILPVWADPDVVLPLVRENSFRNRLGLHGKFVVMYSGNLGYTSCLEDVIEAARFLCDDQEIVITIIGEGIKKEMLKKAVSEHQLANVIFLPYQPREVFPEMLAAADVGLVTLSRQHAQSSLPGKTYNVMASGRPILAIAPEDSDLGRLVKDADCGLVVEPGNPELVAHTIQLLKNNPDMRDEMGKNGRARLVNEFSRERCIGLYEMTLQQTVFQDKRGQV